MCPVRAQAWVCLPTSPKQNLHYTQTCPKSKKRKAQYPIWAQKLEAHKSLDPILYYWVYVLTPCMVRNLWLDDDISFDRFHGWNGARRARLGNFATLKIERKMGRMLANRHSYTKLSSFLVVSSKLCTAPINWVCACIVVLQILTSILC